MVCSSLTTPIQLVGEDQRVIRCGIITREKIHAVSGIEGCEEMNTKDVPFYDVPEAGDRKRRLNMTMGKTFEIGKLRWIDMWFQNGRANLETRQLENVYGMFSNLFNFNFDE